MDSDDLSPSTRRLLTRPARMSNAIGMGDAELVAQILAIGGDPNAKDRRGNSALVRAVRAMIVESSVVQTLRGAGADAAVPDADGLTPLDHARRRLLKFEGKPRKPARRSPSLTDQGDVRLAPFENKMLDSLHRDHPDIADDYEAMYLEQRRKAAERVFDTRGNLERIVGLLEARA